MLIPALIVVAALPASMLLARLAVRLAPRLGLLDVPNERSSHRRVTPRGGGLAIVVTGTAGLLALGAVLPAGDECTAWPALVAAGLLVAAVGLLDDRRSAPPGVKFVVQFGAAALLLATGTVVRSVEVPAVGRLDLGALAVPLTLVWLVAHTNLFNFMDGIDGLAAGHAAAAGAFLGWWGLAAGDALTGTSGLCLAAVSLGFLTVNRPPARIFMGDVGSLFLGLGLAALSVRAASARPGVPFPVSFLVLGPFIYDAVFTLGRRLLAGENVLRAHRSHLYQRLVILGRSHAEVTGLYVGLTLACGALGTLYLAAPATAGPGAIGLAVAAMVGISLLVRRAERAAGGRG